MEQTCYLFKLWGYDEDSFAGRTVIDVGAGSRLRSKFFRDATIIAIEPLGKEFLSTIAWSDLGDASALYSVPAEKYLRALATKADLVMCINTLNHCYDPRKVVANMARYLKPQGELCLSCDTGDARDPLHPSPISGDELLTMVRRVGLRVDKHMSGLGNVGDNYGEGLALTVIARRGDV